MLERRLLAVVVVLSIAGAAGAQPVVSDPTLQLTAVVGGISNGATAMAFLGPNDFLVTQKNDGQVRRVLNGVLQPTPVLDVAVNNDSERGLLGIAINTATPPQVFLYYTESSDPDGDGLPENGVAIANRVYRYTWNAAAGQLQNRQLVLDLPVNNGPNHDGGSLVLGPTPTPGPNPPAGDGSPLYVVIGDLNRFGQLQNNSSGSGPDDSGVILRVGQDGAPYPGNPFVPYCSVSIGQTCPNGSGCPAGQTCRTNVARYFAYGVRNSFGLALDPVSGALWDTENGAGSYDEINYIAPGFNSGWVSLMGPDSRDPEGLADLFFMPGGASVYSDPEFSWLSPVAVTAIAFPTGGALGPAYDHVALVGDFNFGNLYRLQLTQTRDGFEFDGVAGLADRVADDASERNLVRLGNNFGGITDLERGPDGAIYILTLSGSVHRLGAVNPPTPTPTATATPTPYTVSGQVRYYFASRPVPDVVVAATGSGNVGDNTDATSAYSLAPLPLGNWLITPRKLGGANGGLSALDGAHILQRAALLRAFTPFQTQACDVTGDGTCSALDGARVLQVVAGLATSFEASVACQSDWLFLPLPAPAPNQTLTQPLLAGGCVPGAIAYQPLAGSASAQDFIAILIGDVTGNWAP